MTQLERAMDQVNLERRARAAARGAPTPTPTTGARRRRSASGPAASSGCTPTTSTRPRPPAIPRPRSRAGSRSAARAACPSRRCERYAERFARDMPSGIARVIEPDRPLVDGRRDRDRPRARGRCTRRPGHAPSHVCLFQPERRLLISGDHVLGRISLFYDYGWTPDPVGEFLRSLDVVDALDARLACPATAGRSSTSHGHIDGNRGWCASASTRCSAALARRAEDGARDRPARVRRGADAARTPPGG